MILISSEKHVADLQHRMKLKLSARSLSGSIYSNIFLNWFQNYRKRKSLEVQFSMKYTNFFVFWNQHSNQKIWIKYFSIKRKRLWTIYAKKLNNIWKITHLIQEHVNHARIDGTICTSHICVFVHICVFEIAHMIFILWLVDLS